MFLGVVCLILLQYTRLFIVFYYFFTIIFCFFYSFFSIMTTRRMAHYFFLLYQFFITSSIFSALSWGDKKVVSNSQLSVVFLRGEISLFSSLSSLSFNFFSISL